MSTATESAPSPIIDQPGHGIHAPGSGHAPGGPVKLPNNLKLTREALYMLEACLRQAAGVTSTQQAILWEKVQRKCRRTNDRTVKISWDEKGHDFETKLLRNDGETDLAWARRSKEWGEAHAAWQDEAVELSLSNKHFNAAKEAVKFVFDNGYKEGTRCMAALPLSPHTTCLLIELKLGDPEKDDE
jgi:hypothetical protein